MGILRDNVQEEHKHLLSLEWKLFSVSLILLFVARTLYLLHSIRKIRQMRDPRKSLSPSTSSASSQEKPLKTLIVLGSGGHTTEMLELIKKLDPVRFKPIVLVVASSDTTSLKRVQAYSHQLPIQNKDHFIEKRYNANDTYGNQHVYRIPRSREVGQSYFSSIFTTSYSFIFAFWLVGFQVQPDLVLANGPGTCLPIAFSAFVLKIIGWKRMTKIVFVESFCRVTSLSLTGKLLYPIADLFAVCWDQLHEEYPLTYLVTSFIPNSKIEKKLT